MIIKGKQEIQEEQSVNRHSDRFIICISCTSCFQKRICKGNDIAVGPAFIEMQSKRAAFYDNKPFK